jgi:hypothetical protein
MPRYQHFVESERILAMLANNTLPITVRPQSADLVHLLHAAHGSEHAAAILRPVAVLLFAGMPAEIEHGRAAACRVQSAPSKCRGG